MIQRRILLLFAAFIVAGTAMGQNLSISGTIRDVKSSNTLPGATLLLQRISDSSFARTTQSDSAGRFVFSGLAPDSFRLTVSYVSYSTSTQGFRLDTTDLTADVLLSESSSSELSTVIIRTTPSPVTQRDDTLQVNASQFKVNPDATSEDLIRKVPGITIENGQVKAQGETVQKVTIDGRELFGDDATAALRNLPAEVVDKIQIFDRLSDQAQFSGFDDGSATRSINIVTKANMRNGQFGRVYAGYGTDQRYSAGGNATFLKENRRISLVGNFNNINQQNFSQQDLLGVSSNGANRGGGGRGGDRGSRGGGGAPGGNRGNSGGPGGFQANSNFLVGQQAGINTTSAAGVNYSDLWGKNVTATGSYFFNRTNNITNELASTRFLSGDVNDVFQVLDTTNAGSSNTNHRMNMRIEWRIDSNNQIIFTPNLSFQENSSNRNIASRSFFFPEGGGISSFNRNITNSDRSGNNLNGTLLYRHSFPKRGRTISVNLNTSYNQRNGESFVETFARFPDSLGNYEDSASNRFADQSNNGLQVSTNLAYTEPLGKNVQLQANYNPTWSKSESNQQTYALDPGTGKYSTFLNNFSNVFENSTQAQNGGLTLRMGERNRQFSIGASYQHTKLNSERIFPIRATVNKTFSNILPNANLRYAFTPRSSVRVFYRASVNQPSVTQLQDVLDPTNAPVYTRGNPELRQQYTHTMSASYTFTNSAKGLLFVGNVFYQNADDYIANQTSQYRDPNEGVIRLTQPVNLDGYKSLRSFVTLAFPFKAIKSNINFNGGVSFTTLPGIVNDVLNITDNRTITLGSVIASNISQYVDFTVSYSANFSNVENEQRKEFNDDYFQHSAGLQLNLLNKKGWFLQSDVTNNYFSGLTQSFNQNFWLWNAGIGKKFLKDQKGELRLNVFDLLEQNQSIARNVTETYIEDVQNRVLQRYFLLTFSYNLRNFGAK